jgi:hypothetical protein
MSLAQHALQSKNSLVASIEPSARGESHLDRRLV